MTTCSVPERLVRGILSRHDPRVANCPDLQYVQNTLIFPAAFWGLTTTDPQRAIAVSDLLSLLVSDYAPEVRLVWRNASVVMSFVDGSGAG